jgi:hypothetical protein
MKAQSIDLSPLKILSYFKDFERRLPRLKSYSYTSLVTQLPLTDESLDAEVRNMCAYLGMEGLVPECRFISISDDKGGYIELGAQTVKISVSESLKNNVKAVLATLAHEVCHKYLFIHHVYFPNMVEVNEVYTDLCTIYVGFGHLIMEGYNTQVGCSKCILGYLDREVYLSAYGIMCAVLGRSMVDVTEANELNLEDTLELWYNSDDKRRMMMDQFASIEHDEARLFRNIRYLSEMLRQVLEITRKRMDTMQNVFFGKDMFNATDKQTVNQPVHLFAAIYESIEDKFDGGDNALFVEMNKILEEAMGKIMHLCPDIETSSFPNMQIECPFCGNKSDAARYAGKSVTLKCTDCKKYFRVNLEELSVEPLRENQPEEQKKGQEKTDSQAMERLMNDMPWWLQRLTAKYVDKYL